MSIKIYRDKRTKERIEADRLFAGCTPMEAAIEPGMERLTLDRLGRLLQKQLENRGAIGITLIEVRFAMIVEPNSNLG